MTWNHDDDRPPRGALRQSDAAWLFFALSFAIGAAALAWLILVGGDDRPWNGCYEDEHLYRGACYANDDGRKPGP